jgi:hypothetical protein
VTARGIFNGIGDNLFNPDGTMTRAMFAAVLANIEGVDLSTYTTSRFTDVSVGTWYASAVEWAADMGIVNGVGDNRFNPDAEITREQMAVMLANYVWYKQYILPQGQTGTFNDEASISSWALNSVKIIQAAGIIGGRPGNVFDPQGTATRAEVATIFTNYINAYINHVMVTNNVTTAANTQDAWASSSPKGERPARNNNNPNTGGGMMLYAILPGRENELGTSEGNNDGDDDNDKKVIDPDDVVFIGGKLIIL